MSPHALWPSEGAEVSLLLWSVDTALNCQENHTLCKWVKNYFLCDEMTYRKLCIYLMNDVPFRPHFLFHVGNTA